MFIKKTAIFLSLLGVIVLPGCATVTTPPTLSNASPVAQLADVSTIKPIPYSLIIVPESSDSNIDNDVRSEFIKMKLFTKIIPGRELNNEAAQMRLVVSFDSKSKQGMGGAILSGIAEGLTFGLAGGDVQQDWYEVTVSACLLSKGGQLIGEYQGTGRYETSIDDDAAVADKMNLATQRVQLSFTHAIRELATLIKQDRENIINKS